MRPKTETSPSPTGENGTPTRDMLFLSHANPEDNEFTLWLALQLANEGYPVWCDLTKLLGGERFWTNIEKAIRGRTIKFLYVLSTTSNEKVGTRQELQLAQSVEQTEKFSDFILPLHIDALPFSDANILLQGIIGISFKAGWQIGLASLLRKLDEEKIPKKAGFNPATVADWWRSNCGPDQGIRDESEDYTSNWFQVSEPPRVYVHSLKRSGIGLIEVPAGSPVPAYQDGISLFSFAQATELERHLQKSDISIAQSDDFSFLDYIAQAPDDRARRKRESCLCNLLRIAWEHSMALRGLPQHALANRASCSYFVDGFASNNTIRFQGVFGKPAERAMIGSNGEERKTLLALCVQLPGHLPPDARVRREGARGLLGRRQDALEQCEPTPSRASEPMQELVESGLAGSYFAAVSWLADTDGMIRLPVADGLCVEACPQPVRFRSPVSYLDPQAEADSALPPEPAGDEESEPFQLDEMEDDDDEDEDATPADGEEAEG